MNIIRKAVLALLEDNLDPARTLDSIESSIRESWEGRAWINVVVHYREGGSLFKSFEAVDILNQALNME